jgi:hypothetical protein
LNASLWTAAVMGDFGLILCLAAAAKLASPSEFATAVTRVLPRSWWVDRPRLVAQSGRIVAVAEASMAPIIVFGGVAGAGLATVLALVFVTAVRQALKRGSSCGCWGSFSPGRAGGSELARAAALAVISAAALAAMLGGVRPKFGAQTVGIAGLLLMVIVAVGHLGARLRRPSAKRPAGVRETSVRGVRQAAAWLLLATTVPAGNELPERPLWPWQNRRTLRRWQTSSTVATELARVDAEISELAWHKVVVRQIGSERRARVFGSRVHLLVSETRGATGPVYQCWAIALPRTPATPATSAR